MATMKFAFEDFPIFIYMLYYLTQTDCGKKNQNAIIYISLVIKVLNTYFGFFYRILNTCYVWRRLKSYQRKVEVRISNLQLANFGFRNIRNKLVDNNHVESLVLTGENYEYMVINKKSAGKIEKCLKTLPVPDKIEFLDINKVRIESIRQVKDLFLSIAE